jgi:hypothetical protein
MLKLFAYVYKKSTPYIRFTPDVRDMRLEDMAINGSP